MTTIFGLRHPKVDLALLAADRQTTIYGKGQDPEKDLEGRKLWLSDNQMYAFGCSGVYDRSAAALAADMRTGKIDMEKVLRDGKFPELRELNLLRLGDEVPYLDRLSNFIIISRVGEDPKLYACFPLGKVEQRIWHSIGTGGAKVADYMDGLNKVSEARSYLGEKRPTNSDDVIRVGLEAVRYAQGKDIYSSGLDLIVLTPHAAVDCFEQLQEDFGRKIKGVQKQVKKSL